MTELPPTDDEHTNRHNAEPLTQTDYQSLLNAAEEHPPELELTVTLAAYTDLRPEVLAEFHPSWFDTNYGLIRVPTEHTESSNAPQFIALSNSATQRIERTLEQHDAQTADANGEAIQDRIAAVIETAGLRDISPTDVLSGDAHQPSERATGDLQVASAAELEALIDQFIESQSERLRPETRASYSLILDTFKSWCTSQSKDEATKEDTDEVAFPIDIKDASTRYIERHAAQLSETTSRSHRTLLNAFSTWTLKEDTPDTSA